MTHEVRLSPAARNDLDRLAKFLSGKNVTASTKVVRVLRSAVESLAEMPDRGRPAHNGKRELIVPFGSGVYLIRYRVDQAAVVVTRIFHGLEDRPLA
jgi:plasmid stabilization system protein ParE